MTMHAASWATTPSVATAGGTSGTVSPDALGAANAGTFVGIAGMSGMSGISATAADSAGAGAAAWAAGAPGFFTPNLPAGRTVPPPGRVILRVLRWVADTSADAADAAGSSDATDGGATILAVAFLAEAEPGPSSGRSTGRLIRMVFIGAPSFLTGAAPTASASEIREVFDLAACFCASVSDWLGSAIMPVLCRMAC